MDLHEPSLPPPAPPRGRAQPAPGVRGKGDRSAPSRGRSLNSLARKLGLKIGDPASLTVRRVRHGRGYRYLGDDGKPIRDPELLARFRALAVPPAYQDVRYALDPKLHLQAIGRDAAGRLQYRYHPDWEKVREIRKAHRLARLVESLPTIRRSIAQRLAADEATRDFALAAVIELIARTAIRPGHESYARLNGTRGATTLLKSNVALEDESIVLSFRAKGGKQVRKECDAARLARAVEILRSLPGRRLFQYRDASGEIRPVTAMEVNHFLREIAGVQISLKDFRTLMASAAVMDSLSRISPAPSARGRRRQVLTAVRAAADDLANTPAICRKSYVHDTVVTAFEEGLLERFAATLKGCRSAARREQLLAKVVAAAAG